jgi:hypothetical protein
LTHIAVAVVIDAPPEVVWARLERIEDHTSWMADAAAIRFESSVRRGVGTRMVVDTRVGPLRLADRMEITEWIEGHSIAVRHCGLVTGDGRFTLDTVGPAVTRFAWTETLRFPWWLGGPVGGLVGGQLLAAIWRRNLLALKHLCEPNVSSPSGSRRSRRRRGR